MTMYNKARLPLVRGRRRSGRLALGRNSVASSNRLISINRLRNVLLGSFAMVLLPITPAMAQMSGLDQVWSLLAMLQQQLVGTLTWIDSLGAIAPIAFILLYIVITVALLPASVVTLGAGVVFGIVKGSLLVFVGAMLGATAAFLVGRYLARGWVANRIANRPKFQAIDTAIGREGRKVIFLLRLSPVFPFNLLNYGLGLSRVSLQDYVLGTLGILPGTILYVYLGSLVGNLAMLGTGEAVPDPQAVMVQWVLRIVGMVATVAVTVYITRIAQQALKMALPGGDETAPNGSP